MHDRVCTPDVLHADQLAHFQSGMHGVGVGVGVRTGGDVSAGVRGRFSTGTVAGAGTVVAAGSCMPVLPERSRDPVQPHARMARTPMHRAIACQPAAMDYGLTSMPPPGCRICTLMSVVRSIAVLNGPGSCAILSHVL